MFCLIGTFILSLLLIFVAQSSYLIAPLTYMPHLFLGPLLLLLALPGLWWGRGRMLFLLAAAFGFHFLFLGWRLPKAPQVSAGAQHELRLAFVNRGDQDHAAWDKWVPAQNPDLVCLTDVRGKNGHGLGVNLPIVAGLPHLMRIGEHALASRFPFTGTQVARIDKPPGQQGPPEYLPAARFEVEAPGGTIVVYIVHIRSPRDALSKYRSFKLWQWTLFGAPVGVPPSITIDHYWQDQLSSIEGLLKCIESETLPTLVMGDWNLPDIGPRYRRLTENLQDAHTAAGSGFGHTFPGDLSHWAALGQPWMRIDYLLTDRQHWSIEEFYVQTAEEAALSQHRGLLAKVSLTH